MVVVVVPFSHSEDGCNPAVAGGMIGGVGLFTNHMAQRIDAECGMLHHDHPGNTRNQENPLGLQRMADVSRIQSIIVPNKSGHDENNHKRNKMNPFVLPGDQLVIMQIMDIIKGAQASV